MNTRDEIIASTYQKWSEHIEMHPGREWEMMSLILSTEMERLLDLNAYYKGLLCMHTNKTQMNG